MLDSMRGREARPAGAAWHVAKTLAQTVVFWSTFLFLVPGVIYRIEGAIGGDRFWFASPTSRIAGVVVFTLGGTLGLTCGILMAVQGRGTPLPEIGRASCRERVYVLV